LYDDGAGRFIDFGSYGESKFETHGMWFGPYPHGIGQGEALDGTVIRRSTPQMSMQGRYLLQTQFQQFRTFGFQLLPILFRRAKATTPPTLMNGQLSPSRSPLQQTLEIKLLRQTRTTLIGRVGENHSPTQTTWNLNCRHSIRRRFHRNKLLRRKRHCSFVVVYA
jgi:hypothetical protein